MIMSGHVIDFKFLKKRKNTRLSQSKNFYRVGNQELDGNYVVLDNGRDNIFRSGCASNGMYTR